MGAQAARSLEVAGKLDQVRRIVAGRGYAAAALRSRRNFSWLTAGGDSHVIQGSDAGVAALVVTESRAVVIAGVNETSRLLDEELDGLPFEIVAVPWERPELLETKVAEVAGGPVGGDADLEDELRGARSLLTARERDRMEWLGERATRAVTSVLASARRGDRETEIAGRLTAALAKDGIRAPCILVASDERIARYRHPIPKLKPVERSVMLVVGAEVDGLVVAMTRFAWVRGGPDDDTQRRFEAASAIHVVMRAGTRPGRSLADVLADGIAAYERQGFESEWRLHHQGGTIGYGAREDVATPGCDRTTELGMAFAWNPSITGVKVEDTFILCPDGSQRVVTRDPNWPAGGDGEPGIWTGLGRDQA